MPMRPVDRAYLELSRVAAVVDRWRACRDAGDDDLRFLRVAADALSDASHVVAGALGVKAEELSGPSTLTIEQRTDRLALIADTISDSVRAKAIRLVAEHRVVIHEDTAQLLRGTVVGDSGFWQVYSDPDGPHCSCPHGEHSPHRRCSHVAALALASVAAATGILAS